MTTIEAANRLKDLDGYLHGFALKLTKNTDNADDLFQDTALRVISHLDKFQDGTNFRAWACTIMKNIFINQFRKNQTKATLLDPTPNTHFLDIRQSSTQNEGEWQVGFEEISTMVKNLKPDLCIPFVMANNGFRYDEIAAELDLPLGTVKSRIYFARQELRDKLCKIYHYN